MNVLEREGNAENFPLSDAATKGTKIQFKATHCSMSVRSLTIRNNGNTLSLFLQFEIAASSIEKNEGMVERPCKNSRKLRASQATTLNPSSNRVAAVMIH